MDLLKERNSVVPPIIELLHQLFISPHLLSTYYAAEKGTSQNPCLQVPHDLEGETHTGNYGSQFLLSTYSMTVISLNAWKDYSPHSQMRGLRHKLIKQPTQGRT